jgi:hypothetical protein
MCWENFYLFVLSTSFRKITWKLMRIMACAASKNIKKSIYIIITTVLIFDNRFFLYTTSVKTVSNLRDFFSAFFSYFTLIRKWTRVELTSYLYTVQDANELAGRKNCFCQFSSSCFASPRQLWCWTQSTKNRFSRMNHTLPRTYTSW